MSKLNLFIQSQITESDIVQEKSVFNEGKIDTVAHLYGETTIAPGATKPLFSGSSQFVFIQSDKEVELDLGGEKVIISPMFQGIHAVDAVFASTCVATSVSVKNTSAQTATIKFLFVE